jgi:C-terminal processing protease CtpA/Prc
MPLETTPDRPAGAPFQPAFRCVAAEDSTAGVRLTTAKFYSPKGKPCAQVGVEPDLVVRTTARPINGQPLRDDAVLTAATQTARNISQQLQARKQNAHSQAASSNGGEGCESRTR